MKEEGFFTMEVLLVGLLLTALVAATGLYIKSMRMIASSANMTTAACLAQKQIACVEGEPALWESEDGAAIPWQDGKDALPLVKNGTAFDVVTLLRKGEAALVKRVEVVVSWREFGREKQVRLSAALWKDE